MTNETSEAVNRQYKDSLFRRLFDEKEALLSLYNAVNGTKYQDAETMPIEKAVERVIEECIKEGVLADFLRKHRSEAIRMSILEFDEEREMKLIRKAEFEGGYEEGYEGGYEEGYVAGEVSLIRKQQLKGKTTEEIAEILDLDIDRVGRAVDYITKKPVLDDREIAAKIVEKCK